VFTFDDLVATLDVEEKARTKDTCGKGVWGPSSANFVQRGNPKSNLKPQNKKKKPPQTHPRLRKLTSQPRRRRKAPAMCVGVRTTLLHSVRTIKTARSLPTWLLVRLEEQ
jgi:hypothetical protein